LRGLQSQRGEAAEDKIVTCIQGEVFDVCVDTRKDSPSFGEWYGVNLSPENGLSLYVPKGFAHGYLTMTEDTRVLYFTTQFYKPGAERGFRFDEPRFAIEWPLSPPFIMSEKDKSFSYL
ncbi:MAG: dTDP-4-dehydrorhamnose 3,5-epimerase, partial [Oscillospiraceae bacterium]|nr:dTDP-4-dehydrorhamnose 3,5-epimerase [Oscillospiraceae bacterium]